MACDVRKNPGAFRFGSNTCRACEKKTRVVRARSLAEYEEMRNGE